MNTPFLDQLAGYLLSEKKNFENVMIVAPGRRPFVYLRHYLSAKITKATWLPEMLTIEDLAAKLSGLKPGENIDLLFTLFESCKSVGSVKTEFQEFLKWGPIALSDFNEIDSHLADRKKLYNHLQEARVLETWNPGQESLTDFQKKYLEFWNSLGAIHEDFVTRCESIGTAYDGLILRKAANIESQPEWLQKKDIIICGFNALAPAEEKILQKLVQQGAEEFFDADDYYLNDPGQEAGKFLRDLKKTKPAKAFGFSGAHLISQKKIQITGVAGESLQGKLAGSILNESGSQYGPSTAVVLGDEALLLPLLNSLPIDVPVNVTMGFPLSASPVYRLYRDVLEVLRTRTPSGKFHHSALLAFLSNPSLRLLSEDAEACAREVSDYIRRYNLLKVNMSGLREHSSFGKFLDELDFIFGKEKLQPAEVLLKLTAAIVSQDINESLIRDQVYHLNNILVRLNELLNAQQERPGIGIFADIFDQLVKQDRLAFRGEPLEGIQVMGFLESRLLDFDTLILAGVNEGVVPAGKTVQTFIPWDVRRGFELFTYHDKDAIYAYHFYRLIQRARNISLIYSTSKDETGGGEKSRFIAQLESELANYPGIEIQHDLLNLPSALPENIPDGINRNEETTGLISDLLERGISPSALNTYLACKLDFFYKYLLRISETGEVEEEVEAASMGTFIHEALENQLKPYVGKHYDFSVEQDFDKLCQDAFRKSFTEEDLATGKNHIALSLASTYLKMLETREKQILSERNPPLIVELEKALSYRLSIKDRPVLFKGFADRVEKTDNCVTIIDYKTGKVESKELAFENIEELFSGEKPKALQLALYAWLYSKENTGNFDLSAAVISFRNLSEYKIHLCYQGAEILPSSFYTEFEEQLIRLVNEISDGISAFTHNETAEYCEYCK